MLKCFVWEDVLCSWSDGIIFIVAPDIMSAWEMLREDIPVVFIRMQGGNPCDAEFSSATVAQSMSKAISLTDGTQPREVTKPESFIIYGGD